MTWLQRAAVSRPATALLGGLVGLYGRTWRIKQTGWEMARRLRDEGRGVIFVTWHRMLLAPVHIVRNRGYRVLVSRHFDGELVARALERTGFRTVRGSSTRGGGEALDELTQEIRRGGEVVLTPDGPRGPVYQAKPGTAVLAHRTGAPVVPCACVSSSAWELSSWDRFLVPKPFCRVVLRYGEPLRFRSSTTVRNVAASCRQIERALQEVTTQARADLAAFQRPNGIGGIPLATEKTDGKR